MIKNKHEESRIMPCQKKVIFLFAITEPVIIYIWCLSYRAMGYKNIGLGIFYDADYYTEILLDRRFVLRIGLSINFYITVMRNFIQTFHKMNVQNVITRWYSIIQFLSYHYMTTPQFQMVMKHSRYIYKIRLQPLLIWIYINWIAKFNIHYSCLT